MEPRAAAAAIHALSRAAAQAQVQLQNRTRFIEQKYSDVDTATLRDTHDLLLVIAELARLGGNGADEVAVQVLSAVPPSLIDRLARGLHDLAALSRDDSLVVNVYLRTVKDLTRDLSEITSTLLRAAISSAALPVDQRDILNSLFLQTAVSAAGNVLEDAGAVAQARSAGEEAAGQSAESSLAKEFEGYGRSEAVASRGWLMGSVVCISAALVLTYIGLDHYDDGSGWRSAASHLLIALPALAFAAYCSREATKRRQASQWAHRLAVQLKSIHAYTSRLTGPTREVILADFGRYVFGPHLGGKDDNQIQSIPPEIVAAVADVVKARGAGAP